jgi:hypothetical protein
LLDYPASERKQVYGIIVQNNPINSIDPSGLLNILVGGGFSVMAPTGIEASGGIVINPGFGKDVADIGVFGSAGAGGGVNISYDYFAGFVKGGIENVKGVTANINITAWIFSVTIFTDPHTGEIIGGTIGYGPSATPVGASGSISQTGTYTFRQFLNQILKPCRAK